jgi:hypothetical protein
MTVVVREDTSEQSEDCSYKFTGLIYCRYLVRAGFRAGHSTVRGWG